tara:strand:- start:65 stop:220 length:156 start_codon:yes stop_codon:yes gene_type:complete
MAKELFTGLMDQVGLGNFNNQRTNNVLLIEDKKQKIQSIYENTQRIDLYMH